MLETIDTISNSCSVAELPDQSHTPKNICLGRVLLVDDSRTVRKAFANRLSPKFECSEAGSFNEALIALKANEFDVVITDIIMPGISGVELLRKIVEDYPNTEVIVVSGVARPQRALDAMRLGAFDYIIKPCDLEVLELTVERSVKHRLLKIYANRTKKDLETKNEELNERKEQLEHLQTQIVQSAKMASLGQLAAGVAHELNNPVGFLHANLEMLDEYLSRLSRLLKVYDENAKLTPERPEFTLIKEQIGYPLILEDVSSSIKDCREGADRIRDIVQNLKHFSRLDEAEYSPTDINEGIESTVRLISNYFSSGDIVLIRHYSPLPTIQTFPGQLNQVWMNLVVNAAQSIVSGRGEVTIKTRADDEDVYVEISDNGCGIAVQNISKIFDPFFTTKPVGEGTGLGLSISFGIVRRHGGEISVKSVLGEGTTFTIRLPRNFEPESATDEKSIVSYSKD